MDFGQKGGQGDYTVFEIFKALEECALTQAFVIGPRGRLASRMELHGTAARERH